MSRWMKIGTAAAGGLAAAGALAVMGDTWAWRWAGEFQRSPGGGWSPFTAEQHFTIDPPGFVWDAEIRMLPLVPMRVRDGYVGGAASMLGSIGGLVPTVDQP